MEVTPEDLEEKWQDINKRKTKIEGMKIAVEKEFNDMVEVIKAFEKMKCSSAYHEWRKKYPKGA